MELSTEQFWATFFAAISMFYRQDLDPGNTPQSDVHEMYDFIIVGGGTAGCVLANRLTEIPDWSVLLIEAGGPENSVSDTPLFEIVNHHSDRDWNYTTVRQAKSCQARDGICEYPRGRVLGGGSTINGMMYVRGNKVDFDDWVKLGCTGWDFDNVLQYFKKLENVAEPSLAKSPYRGVGGNQNVQYARYRTPLAKSYIKAGEELGWKKMDFNAENQDNSIDYVQFTIKGRSRESTSKAYLKPAENRKNLHIIQRSLVTKIILDKTVAKGVEYYRDGKLYRVGAKKEVIVSAGAINTPQILMLSGIGPKKHLEEHKIEVIADLPVGEGLQDHPLVPIIYKISKPYTITTDVWKTNESIYAYAEKGKGPLTTSGGEAMAFFNPFNESEPSSFQTMMHSFMQEPRSNQTKQLVRTVSAVVHPLSKGSVRLRSGDFRDPPLIDPNYFGDDTDFQVMKKGLEKVVKFMETKAMSEYSPEIYVDDSPNCKDKKDMSAFIDCVILEYSQTVYHPTSTAKMGHPEDKTAVVSPNLVVRGFENLRVIDASIMPFVTRGNTNAPTIMIAEKGADIVKSFYKTSLPS